MGAYHIQRGEAAMERKKRKNLLERAAGAFALPEDVLAGLLAQQS